MVLKNQDAHGFVLILRVSSVRDYALSEAHAVHGTRVAVTKHPWGGKLSARSQNELDIHALSHSP